MRCGIRPLLLAVVLGGVGVAQEPRAVKPADGGQPPSDALVLFDGQDLSKWRNADGGPTGCKVEDRVMVCRTGDGHAFSRETFRDAQIHIEFAPPNMPDQKSQRKGNSGVYLQGRYEVQVLDSYNNPTNPMGVVGAIYGTAPPLVNAARPPEQWQSYDIIFHAPRCSGDQLVSPGTVTVLLNGVLVQDHVSLKHRGNACGQRNVGEPGPLMLQDHSGFPNAPHTEMRFRNIWLRHLQ